MTHKPTYVILLTFILLYGCQEKKVKQATIESAVPVVTSRAARIPVSNEISLSGNIEGNKTVRLVLILPVNN